jgi:serine/threonine-protein phosphatase Stp1
MLAKSSLSLDDHVRQTRDLLAQANAELIKVNQESLASAATLVCLLFHEGDAACLWSGDSRCYLFRGGVLYQCTRDHTLRQHKIDLGELTVPEAKRMVSGHVVTNAIGVTQELNLEEVRLKIMAEDRFLLCSDGLSNLLSPEALASGLLGTSAKDCVDELMRFIEHKEQPDNITALVVSLGSLR